MGSFLAKYYRVREKAATKGSSTIIGYDSMNVKFNICTSLLLESEDMTFSKTSQRSPLRRKGCTVSGLIKSLNVIAALCPTEPRRPVDRVVLGISNVR